MKEDTYKICYGPMLGDDQRVVRRRTQDGEEKLAIVKPVKEGRSFAPGEELIDVGAGERDENGDVWHPVTVTYRHGPAQVATREYREGYDRIFMKKSVGEA